MRNVITLVAAGLLITSVVGCTNATNKPALTLVNEHCPITGELASAEATTEWNGKTVGFCCADCLPAWNELSGDEKAAKIESGSASKHESHEHGSP